MQMGGLKPRYMQQFPKIYHRFITESAFTYSHRSYNSCKPNSERIHFPLKSEIMSSFEMSNNNNMRLAYNNTDGTPIYTSPAPTYNNSGAVAVRNGAGESNSMMDGAVAKRKRGRPRKYPTADVNNSSSASPNLPHAVESGGFSSPGSSTFSSGKKRGRPPGSLNKQHHYPAASGSPGVGFMPHVLDIQSGEDVLAKLMWFSQNSTRALCVLSANGSVSNVTLQQSATSGGTVTYEGRFEILSLSGSFMLSDIAGQRSRTGGLSVALSGPDGRVLGGNVAGLLTAAAPVQVIVGSFVPASQKQTKSRGNNEAEVVNAPLSESSGGGLGSPLGHSNNSNPQGMASMPWR
uniref:AT-hook motif nuclear-localized protein 10-like n=1 Tax=Erigeron canadensis TaxID=72917 RepID=UPI001CB9A55A|nr:AT-hook motif nuclear-localized protein 10-like [Erigeron canadensis]